MITTEHTALATWLTPKEAAQRLNIHQVTLLRLARAGVVPHLRAGRAVRFDLAAVEQALTINRAA